MDYDAMEADRQKDLALVGYSLALRNLHYYRQKGERYAQRAISARGD